MSEVQAAHRQLPFTVRFDWGHDGAMAVAPGAELAVVVDVLCFTTCVSVAVDRGADVFPYAWKDGGAAGFAAGKDAVLAGRRGGNGVSLSPASLRSAPLLERLVLPSPNGSALAHALSGTVPRVAAVCLRNARATAEWAARNLPPAAVVAVIAAGEKWPNGGLRPALEDQLGAGAFLAALPEQRRPGFSPEARWAMDAFTTAEPRLGDMLLECSTGRELVFGGYQEDVEIAGELNQSAAVALLDDGAFRRA
ncbi:2-phosphosulfolactate phosphatase [Arthrobacter sp. B10-11]|uniref:2-phosphosulfolactate phosphatase n=1 Tax=Arthrobacter sp. B10-11 TaxID=3081160 RepID=UPI002953AA48|nr:2-phosphosulfolactate phosphatase [Arthrobacter sp. B10-11]MDV8148828.1 2-phosphosulfolactate phosphatase [Arthrobacter sp. B10-11]